jgi:hypothetical protein
MPSEMQRVAQAVLSRARRAGYVVSRDIREELAQVGEPATRWKEVVREAGSRLTLKNGRYYYVSPVRNRVREGHQNLESVKRATRGLIRQYKASNVQHERRTQRRIHFILPVMVVTDDGNKHQVVTQDISLNGVRIIASVELRGQKALIFMPSFDRGDGQWAYTVQFLWSSKIGDNLIENGGIFLEVHDDSDKNGR